MSLLKFHLLGSFVAFSLIICTTCDAQDSATSTGDELLAKYFAAQTAIVTNDSLADVKTLEDWTRQREERHAQLQEMLGLKPWPERSPLKPVVTGTHTREGVIVENLHFQAMPGLYVTANFYRPEKQEGPLPAILYVCGHGGVKKDGVSYGNKTHYQHHGAWFAKNGFVCLMIDTIQLGEIEGIHHGTYKYGMWWWLNRGYTSAGVEAWNCIRSLDYLQSRPEVDGEKIGVTGRSGGGAYSWWVAALDDRIKAAVPVAGITNMHNHVVDGCVEGHCDCMYMVNTFAWDFPMLASLVAPRPLLISNTDKDRIFPLDGVVDVYAKTRRIYELHNALGNIGLNIAEGPHKDTQELRVNAFHWMNRFLKNENPLIDVTATPLFTPEELKVFDELPKDERVTSIQESFVPMASDTLPQTQKELDALRTTAMLKLMYRSFLNSPKVPGSDVTSSKPSQSWESDDATLSVIEYHPDAVYSLPMFILNQKNVSKSKGVRVFVCDAELWSEINPRLATQFPDCPYFSKVQTSKTEGKLPHHRPGETLVILPPRGVGPTAWNTNEKKQTQIKRRFALLGQTQDSVQIHDIVQGINTLEEIKEVPLHIQGRGQAADWLLFASMFISKDSKIDLVNLSDDLRDGPYLLQVSQFLTKPQALLIAASQVKSLTVKCESPEQDAAWKSVEKVAQQLGWKIDKFNVQPSQ
ncbi:alpha/beta hydrolase family protein [Thalassoglobus sp.]|uniref:alpha/beta hydrolase family protein n=1 Tax=Thalassoglobus sp. TaxID=2795869 RepID=UPI003AA91397